jgi:hypothetical protein
MTPRATPATDKEKAMEAIHATSRISLNATINIANSDNNLVSQLLLLAKLAIDADQHSPCTCYDFYQRGLVCPLWHALQSSVQNLV